MVIQIPPPSETVDLTMGDGAVIRVRRYARADAVRVDGYYPVWGELRERFELIAFDARNRGPNPLAAFRERRS